MVFIINPTNGGKDLTAQSCVMWEMLCGPKPEGSNCYSS